MAALTLAAALAAACSDSSGPEMLASLTISPATATVAVNGTVQFTATGTRENQDVTTLVGAVWTVSGGGTISSSGLFTAGATPGTSTVTVTCGGRSSVATVTVTAGPLATITVTPNPVTLAIGTQQQFTAVGRDAGGNVVAITPVWSTTSPPGSIDASSGLFTAGNTVGSYPNSVRATSGSIFGTATVNVVAGPLLTITVTPNPTTVGVGNQRQFTAVGRDAGGNVVPIVPVWSTTNPPGTIVAGSGIFTAGNTLGTFVNSVRATQGSVFGTATVTVTAAPPPPPPPPGSTFRVLARAAISCTDGSITGDVGTFLPAAGGSITQVNCPVVGGTTQIGTPASILAYTNFVAAYDAYEVQECGTILTGSLAGVTLAPGVYCFDAAAALTGTLTLSGPPTGVWVIKVGTSGTGALTATNFAVVLAGGATSCNVTWWSQEAMTMTDADFQGAVLTGGDITATRGTLRGNLWSQGDVTITGTTLTACGP